MAVKNWKRKTIPKKDDLDKTKGKEEY